MAGSGEKNIIIESDAAMDVEIVPETDVADAEVGWCQTNPIGKEIAAKTDENFYYTIVAPKSFRPNSEFCVKLTLLKGTVEWANPEPIVVSVAIEDDQDENLFRIERTATMQLNATECITIPVGNNVRFDAGYKLVVKGTQGAIFEHEASLDVQTKKVSILIQTDKGIYKPGDTVRFRVFVLNENLRPAAIAEDQFKIYVTDSCQNRLKQWNGIKTENGVFTDEFQLSDLPNLGKWTITAEVEDEQKVVDIGIEEYVLPKFEVIIEASEHSSLKDESIRAIIRAKYTHGNPVRGKVTVSISEKDQYGCFYSRHNDQKQTSLIERTIDVDGRGTVEISVSELKCDFSNWNYSGQKSYTIKAEMVEDLTGCSQSAKPITVVIHEERYKITTDLHAAVLKAGSKFTAKVSVRNHDDSPIVLNDSNKRISVLRKTFCRDAIDDKSGVETASELELDPNGDAYYLIDTKETETSFTFTAKYLDQVEEFGNFYMYAEAENPAFEPELTNLNLKVLTEKCHINEPVEIEVSSPRKLQLYTYILMARAKIVRSETVELPADAGTSYRFSFVPTFDMAPQVDVIVYCVEDKSLCSTRTSIELKENLDNFIEVNVDRDTVKPGDVVHFNIERNAKSFVGLVGVDQSVLLMNEGNDLVQDEVWNELERFHTQLAYARAGFFDSDETKKKKCLPTYYNNFPDFNSTGLILFTNVGEPVQVRRKMQCRKMKCTDMMPMVMACSAAGFDGVPPMLTVAPKIRKEFPETWLWESIPGGKSDGTLTIRKKVPDTITSWIITGFAIDADHGLGITKAPTKLRVHQPFFVSLNLPYSVKRGEVVSVPCTVFNYLQQTVDVEVTLENEHNEFEFTTDTSIVEDTAFSRKKKARIMSQDGATVTFAIRPQKVGLISLKVVATSPIAGDAIVKNLNVESEGVTQFVNKAVFVDLREKHQMDPINVIVDIPKEALPDSTRIEISCVGDLLGGTIKNLQKLIQLPCGCGEQNMLNFVPNIVVLNYLKNTHQLTVEIEAKAKKYMEIGYQRELTYKHDDGSYSAFGQSDKSGSTWLTAFVAKSFRQAATHITIDEDIVAKALYWLSQTQASDGSFQERGSICHKEMQGGSSNGVALTAYVLCAFLENREQFKQYGSIIEKALNNIVGALQASSNTDTYALSVAAYVLHLADHKSKTNVLNNLMNAAKTNENFKWWDKCIDIDNSYDRQSKMLNVEITAYGLLTLLLAHEETKCMPILKWLLNERNSQGGFEGTQDTIVGIDALARLATKIASENNDVKIQLNASLANGNVDHIFVANATNRLLRQSETLRPDVESVTISASGYGFALIEVSYKFNIKGAEPDPAFLLKPFSKLLNAGNMTLTVDASFQAPPNSMSDRSSMAVLEVSLPSGFVVDAAALKSLESSIETIKKVETKNDETLAVIYFDHLSKDPISLKINGFRSHLVSEQKPVPIIVYDYYDNALHAREFYLPDRIAGGDQTAAY